MDEKRGGNLNHPGSCTSMAELSWVQSRSEQRRAQSFPPPLTLPSVSQTFSQPLLIQLFFLFVLWSTQSFCFQTSGVVSQYHVIECLAVFLLDSRLLLKWWGRPISVRQCNSGENRSRLFSAFHQCFVYTNKSPNKTKLPFSGKNYVSSFCGVQQPFSRRRLLQSERIQLS